MTKSVRRIPRFFFLFLAANCVIGGATACRGQDDAVRLPPFLIEAERQDGPKWFFAEATGLEILSAGDAQETAAFVQNFLRYRRALQDFIPDTLLVKTALPTTLILFPENLLRGLDKETARLLTAVPARETQGRFASMNDLRLTDPDSSFIFIALKRRDSFLNYPNRVRPPVVFSEDSLRFLIQSRVPTPPDWFSVGMARLYAASLFPELEPEGTTSSPDNLNLVPGFEPDGWVSRKAAEALRDDPEASRSILSLRELLVPIAPREKSPDYQRLWAAQAELFVRWAFAGADGPGRERLWQFADEASRHPMTEALFRAHFNEGFADARDALSDYLPIAVRAPASVPNHIVAPTPPIKIRDATRAEIRRIKGEWARRCLAMVATRYPNLRPIYVEKTRQILERALQSADPNPQPLASLALFYMDIGELPHARELFEKHPEIIHARPLAALAHVRLEASDLLSEGASDTTSREKAATTLFSELAAITRESPPLEANYVLASQIAQRLRREPNANERKLISDGAVQFPRNSVLAILAASWDLRAGDFERAQRILELALASSSTPEAREKLSALKQLTIVSHATPASATFK